MRKLSPLYLSLVLVVVATVAASGQSFQVQCPTTTIPPPSTLHNNNSEPAYSAATSFNAGPNGYQVPTDHVNGAIKCQQISGGDGFATMGDGTQTYMFAFGPLSGLSDMSKGLPGTQFPDVFNTVAPPMVPGDPATSAGAIQSPYSFGDPSLFTYNGAVGLAPDLDAIAAGSCTAPCLDG